MIEPSHISEYLMYNTVRICGLTASGQSVSGTGFIVSTKFDENLSILLLITNKHVIENTVSISTNIHTSTANNTPNGHATLSIPGENSGLWINHDTVDLCAFNISNISSEISNPYYKYISMEDLPTEDTLSGLSAIEDIIMVGYPDGLWDSLNNYPLFRRGITASHPNIDFNGEPIFVIDIAAFGGSSGSPVFIYNNGAYKDKDNNVKIGPRLFLLGVLYAGPQINISGRIEIKEVPTALTPVPVISQMINLGHVIKAREIIPLCNAARELVAENTSSNPP